MEELHPKRLLSKIAFAFVEFSRIQVTTNDLKRKAAADNVGLMLCDSELHLLSELANIAQQTIEALPNCSLCYSTLFNVQHSASWHLALGHLAFLRK